MKFEVGQKVRHEKYGDGKIVYDDGSLYKRYEVEFINTHSDLNHLSNHGKLDHCLWCSAQSLTPAELSTGDMLNELVKNPAAKYKLMGGTKNLNCVGSIAVNRNGYFQLLNEKSFDLYAIDLNHITGVLLDGKWTLITEPKEVHFLEAVKAYAEGKTIRCEWDCDLVSTYESGCLDSGLTEKEACAPICPKEILEGKWYIL